MEEAGGIRKAGLAALMRFTSRLASGSPFTTTGDAPPGRAPNMPSGVSRRSPTCRAAGSEPWHV